MFRSMYKSKLIQSKFLHHLDPLVSEKSVTANVSSSISKASIPSPHLNYHLTSPWSNEERIQVRGFISYGSQRNRTNNMHVYVEKKFV